MYSKIVTISFDFLQVKLEVGEEVLVLDTTDQDKWQVRIINQRKEGRFSLNDPNG